MGTNFRNQSTEPPPSDPPLGSPESDLIDRLCALDQQPISPQPPGWEPGAGTATPSGADTAAPREPRPPHPSAAEAPITRVRRIVAAWSIPLRQRWGDLANAWADAGVPHPDDEIQAFTAIQDAIARGEPLPDPRRPAAAAGSDPENSDSTRAYVDTAAPGRSSGDSSPVSPQENLGNTTTSVAPSGDGPPPQDGGPEAPSPARLHRTLF